MVPNFFKAYHECPYMPVLQIWTPDFAGEPEEFPKYLATNDRESVLGLHWKNLSKATSTGITILND